MKRIVVILIGILLFACDSEDANDCFQKAGNIVSKEFTINSFEDILVNRDITLILKEANDFKVVVETGENLLNDVAVAVIDNELVLTDNNTCNYVRDYGITKIYVEAPNVKRIRNSSQYEVKSEGILNYETLNLISENFNSPESFAVGDFRLQLNSQTLRVSSNNLSSFYISGTVNTANVRFFSGAGRFEGANLITQNVIVYHRGSNDMIVNPQESITGEILSTGNVIAVNQPTTVEVEALYVGRLIFE